MTNNQLAENSVNQLLNSVRLARDNAERADNRVDHSFYYALTIALEELQERRKADSEPVAWTWQHLKQWHVTNDEERARDLAWDGVKVDPLYRHAQPAPVTEREPIAWLNDAYLARGVVDGEAGSEDAGPGYIPVYREAQPAPVVSEDLYKLANHIASSKNGLPDEWQDWAEELESDIRRAAMLQAEPVTTANKLGNSPVIPDGWKLVPVEPNGDMLAAAQDAYGETDGDIASTLRTAIAAAPQEVK